MVELDESSYKIGFETARLERSSIAVTLKSVYGRTKAYPTCPKARIFANMLGTLTLTKASLKHIQDLGYTIEIVEGSSLCLDNVD